MCHRKFFCLIMICFVSLSIGCMASAPPEESVADVSTVAATRAPATATAVPTLPTSTATPSLTPSPTSTPTLTPSPTETATPTATFTPWPTVPPEEAADKVMALLADNQNPDCLLPCWWGATPGQTRWQDIEPFLNSFALEIIFVPEHSMYVAMFPVGENINYMGKLNIAYRIDTAEIITDISVVSVNIEGYDPQTMMTLYGVPDEVWLKTMDEPREGVLPFHLIAVYQEQGISFHYYVDATRIGEMVTVCFKTGIETERPDLYPSSPTIYAWIPGEYKGINEISYVPSERYYSLEEKTDLTPQKLYEIFTSSNETPCIDTPADLW